LTVLIHTQVKSQPLQLALRTTTEATRNKTPIPLRISIPAVIKTSNPRCRYYVFLSASPSRAGTCFPHQSAPLWRPVLLFFESTRSWKSALLFLLVGLSIGTCTDYSIGRRFVLRFILYSLFYQSVLPVLHCTFHQSGSSYCPFYQSAPPWRLCTALSSVDPPPRGGFVLHSLSVGPSVEAFTAISISQPLRGGFLLQFLSVGLSVECCTFYRRGFVLLSLSVRPP